MHWFFVHTENATKQPVLVKSFQCIIFIYNRCESDKINLARTKTDTFFNLALNHGKLFAIIFLVISKPFRVEKWSAFASLGSQFWAESKFKAIKKGRIEIAKDPLISRIFHPPLTTLMPMPQLVQNPSIK